MRKKAILLLTCAVFLMTGCSANQLSNAVNNAADTLSKGNDAAMPTNTPAPTSTPGPKETALALGKKATIGDWKVCVKKASVKQKITNGKYRYYNPGKGKSFVVFSLSARNNGKKTEEFLPRVGYENKMVKATLYYKDEYEYSPSELLSYDKDLVTKKIQPLSTESGVIAFEVPKKVAKAKKQLKLKIGTKAETLVYPVK